MTGINGAGSDNSDEKTALVVNGEQDDEAQKAGLRAEISDVPEASVLVNVRTLTGANVSVPLNLLDTLMDVRQSLLEIPETCYYTHYHLRVESQDLNDFTELISLLPEGDQQNGKSSAVVNLVMAQHTYEERSIKQHIRRLREILAPPQVTPSTAAYALLPVMDNGVITPSAVDAAFQGDIVENVEAGPTEHTTLCPLFKYDFGADLSMSSICVIKSLTTSPYNPPPPNCRLQGDIFYYDVSVAGDKTCCITASSKGFFVNRTVPGGPFNAAMDTSYNLSYTLIGLLQQLTPAVKRNFHKLIAAHAVRDPFEAIPRQSWQPAWAAPVTEHVADPARAEESMLSAYGVEVGALSRDWNEEWCSVAELPADTRREKLVRERTMFKISMDFTEAAVKGAMAVVDRNIPPINPMDPEAAHMYVYNNIFFSYATRTKQAPASDSLGDQATYSSANQDLKGVLHYSRAEVKGLYTLATAIVDFKGCRVVAQSVIPGILQGEQLSSLIYGSVDNGQKFLWNEELDVKLKQAASFLRVKQHTIRDGEGKEYDVCAPVECKGIMGTDRRMYLLDLVRITPYDPNYTGDQPDAGLLRAELVREFCRLKDLRAVEIAKKEGKPLDDIPPTAMNVNVRVNKRPVGPLWSVVEKVDGEDESDIKLIQEASALLLDTMIPELVSNFLNLDMSPLDGKQLTDMMHSQGINMRYLGKLHDSAVKVPYVQDLCLREMITRGCKHIFRRGLQSTGPSHLATAVSHALNCLLGRISTPPTDSKKGGKGKKKVANGRGGADVHDGKGQLGEWCSTSLWEAAVTEVETRYGYTLSSDRVAVLDRLRRITLLRSVCKSVGIQVAAREYDFKSGAPIGVEDVMMLFPVAKSSLHQCREGQAVLDAGKACMQMGQFRQAYELLHDALSISHQTFGPLHVHTANCYTALALTCHHLTDAASALTYQQKGIAILEISQGWDSADVALGYGNLALFSHCLQHNRRALYYIRRAEYLLMLVCGPNHPEVSALYINTAMILLDISHVRTALRYLHKALQINETMLGEDHLSTAYAYHATAVTLGIMNAFPLAAKNETRNYEILKKHYGDADQRVIDSAGHIVHFTSNAKLMAQAKEEERTAISGIKFSSPLRPVVLGGGNVKQVATTKKGQNGDIKQSVKH